MKASEAKRSERCWLALVCGISQTFRSGFAFRFNFGFGFCFCFGFCFDSRLREGREGKGRCGYR